MHLTTCSSFAALWRRTADARAEDFLRRVVAREVVFASCTSEAGFGGALEDCATIATPVAGGFRLDGRKIFFTESDVATHFTTCARLEHPELGPHMVFFNGIPIDAPGLAIVRTWDTLGMRATQSNDLPLDGRRSCRDEALFHAYPVGHLDAGIGLSIMSLNVPSFGVVALGDRDGGHGARAPRGDRPRPHRQRRGAARVRRDGGAARVGARRALPPRARADRLRSRRPARR